MGSRTKNSIKNLLVAIAMQGVSIIATFACRTVFAHLLSEEYLGVSGLFSNIMSILSLSELGIANVIIIHLYKPIAEKDEKRVGQLMGFYRRAYTLIGLFVMVCGILLVPALPYIVKSDKEIPYLSIYFMLFVLQSASSYFFAYKRSILIASQQEYICTLVTQIFDLLMKGMQILLLLLTHKYMLYLTVSIITNLGSNIVLSRIADKKFPYLKQKLMLPKAEIKEMLRDVSSMMMHKVGNTVVSSTDNILISSMIGIAYTGRYSNYVMIMNIITQCLTMFLNSISASLGDYNASKSLEERRGMFDVLCFLTRWIFGFGCISFVCLFQPTISLWLGANYLLPFEIVIVISVNFYLNGIFRIPSSFADLNKLYNQTKWKPIAVALINLSVSILCARIMGLIGIFIGTFVSYMLVTVWVDPYYLYKYIWKVPLRIYFTQLFGMTVATVFICGLNWYAVRAVPYYVLKVLICGILPNVCYLLLYRNTRECRFLYSRVKNLIKKPSNIGLYPNK